ncbi:MAG: hypothetical protein J5744_06150 [Oscillospiraceae bacterium]|nr:hypothetical protein [Oscillospiraceae bacterium]
MNPHAYISDPEQIKTVETIRRVDDDGYLYHMDCTYDYYDIPQQFMALFNPGCSAFITKNLEGDVLYCRNYDYSHYLNNSKKNPRTGINVVLECTNPNAKYRSLCVSDAYWLDYKNGSLSNGAADDGKTDISSFILCPYISMDGMNEKGLAVSILALSVESEWQEIPFDSYREKMDENKNNFFLQEPGEVPSPYTFRAGHGSVAVNEKDGRAWVASQRLIQTRKEGKQTMPHTVLMRNILDKCADTEEAVAFAGMFNIMGTMPGADYHIFVADSSGDARLLEWVGDDMTVTKIDHATNHYVSKPDPFVDKCGRDECIKAGLFRTAKAGMREDFLMNLLGLVIQDPTNGTDVGKTQYTCIYNLTKGTMKIFSFGDLSRSWEYSI